MVLVILCCMRSQEFARHDEQPDKHARAYSGTDPRTRAAFECAVRHERFLAPEVFFRPDFVSDEYTTPLPQVASCAHSP